MNWENKIIDYLNGALSAEERKMVENHVSIHPEWKAKMDELKSIFSSIDNDHPQGASLNLEYRFEEMLAREISAQKPSAKVFNFRPLAIAASLIILVGMGVLIGLNYSQNSMLDQKDAQISGLVRDMKNMINDQSVSNRINAINVSYESQANDPEVADLLIKTMIEDESANVRLAAVEALASFESSKKVRDGLVIRILEEEDSFVKIAIIQTLAKFNENNAVYNFDKLIENENTPKFIKDEAHIAKLRMNEI